MAYKLRSPSVVKTLNSRLLRSRCVPYQFLHVLSWDGYNLTSAWGRTYVNREQLRGGGLDTKYDQQTNIKNKNSQQQLLCKLARQFVVMVCRLQCKNSNLSPIVCMYNKIPLWSYLWWRCSGQNQCGVRRSHFAIAKGRKEGTVIKMA